MENNATLLKVADPDPDSFSTSNALSFSHGRFGLPQQVNS